MENKERLSIYQAARTIKRKDNSLYNALRSIYSDSIFISEISNIWPQLPLVANLRCGFWYSPQFHATCYFKSTDGHTNNLSFNTSRLNIHTALLAGQSGGCMIVDSTRKGKRFPDSMSKTIPIWTCVLNRAIANWRNRSGQKMDGGHVSLQESSTSVRNAGSTTQVCAGWDCSLHLPLWIPHTERAAIEGHLDEWTDHFEASGADIASLASSLTKPLRPLWISQRTVIWLNEVPDHDSWDFTPVMLVSASSSNGHCQQRTNSEFSWNYIPGAGDDEESWARGLSPSLFWTHAHDLINSGPDLCNQKVADIVEKDRVYRAQRGQIAPQVSVKPSKFPGSIDHSSVEELLLNFEIPSSESSGDLCEISWLGSSNLAVAESRLADNVINVDCILNCDKESVSYCLESPQAYLHLPIVSSKFDRFSLLRNLPAAMKFAELNLREGKRLLVCCSNGEDISICICLAILTSLFTVEGYFDDGKSFCETHISKLEMRHRLVFICKFAVNARPSRGNLKQVFSYLSGNFLSK